MIGNLNPTFNNTNVDLKSKFMLNYCSVCNQLREKYGLASSFALNFDLTYILFSLEEHIKNSSTTIETKCPSKWYTGKMNALEHPAFSKAADLSIVLATIKLDDYNADDTGFLNSNLALSFASNRFAKIYQKIIPNLSLDTQEILAEFKKVTSDSTTSLDIVSDVSRRLAYQLAYEIGSETKISEKELVELSNYFGLIGSSLSLLDPLVDINEDLAKNKVNILELNAINKKITLKDEFINLSSTYYDYHSRLKSETEHLFKLRSPKVHQMFIDIFNSNINKINESAQDLFNEFVYKTLSKTTQVIEECSPNKKVALSLTSLIPLMGCAEGAACQMGCADGCG